jgi:hypothetical protein
LCYGKTKPNDLEFLTDTINELKNMLQNGIVYNDRPLRVSLKCVVCDAPARSFVKGTKLFSGYYGCDKCSQRGEWNGRLTYPEYRNVDLRTDQLFRQQANANHHNRLSPFCELPIDMIKTFPIDYMHQDCLGVMKRLLLAWVKCGIRAIKMSKQHADLISQKLLEIKQFMPTCFARKPRSLDEIDRWKATELRQFLLYTGKIVLKGILRPDLYEHFLCFSIGISILVSPELCRQHLQYAKNIFEYFVAKSEKLYGKEFLVYNVHTLIHMADEVSNHGCLDAFSAFPFENYLQTLKSYVRHGNKPVIQILNRLSEQQLSSNVNELVSKEQPEIKAQTRPNNTFILDNNNCCEVVGLDNTGILCRVFSSSNAWFNKPCDSRIVGIHAVSERKSKMQKLPLGIKMNKAIYVEQSKGNGLFLRLLHQL